MDPITDFENRHKAFRLKTYYLPEEYIDLYDRGKLSRGSEELYLEARALKLERSRLQALGPKFKLKAKNENLGDL